MLNSHWWRLKPPLQRELETRIGRALVGGQITDGSTITVALEKGNLTILRKTPGAMEKKQATAN